MQKDFQNWNNKKVRIDEIKKRPFFHEREVWFCYIGANIGFEQDGRGDDFLRPVVIIRKFNNEIFWGIPLTKTAKKDLPYYYAFSFIEGVESVAILSQLRLIDGLRLSRQIGEMEVEKFKELKEKLKRLIP